MTGYLRNGFCQTDKEDKGLHVICAYIDNEFLDFTL